MASGAVFGCCGALLGLPESCLVGEEGFGSISMESGGDVGLETMKPVSQARCVLRVLPLGFPARRNRSENRLVCV
jgi:hypothetical protein